MSGSAFGPGLSLLGAWSDAGGCIGNESSIAVCKSTTSVSCSINQLAGVSCYSKGYLHPDMRMPRNVHGHTFFYQISLSDLIIIHID